MHKNPHHTTLAVLWLSIIVKASFFYPLFFLHLWMISKYYMLYSKNQNPEDFLFSISYGVHIYSEFPPLIPHILMETHIVISNGMGAV